MKVRMLYVPYDELNDQPNVIVDGAANAHTVLTLSHWPDSNTPKLLKDDLSAQIVFHYLDRPELHVSASIVSNNHFDQDGLIGIYCLLDPSAAQSQRAFLIDIAAAGDFATYQFREAARVAFVLAAFADPDLSSLDPTIFRERYPTMAGRLYQELLPRLPEIVNHTDQFRSYWEHEDAMLNEMEQGTSRWTFNGVDQITPALTLSGSEQSCIPPETFRSHVAEFLKAKRKRDSAQPGDAKRKRDSAQPGDAKRKRDSAQPGEMPVL